MTLIRYEPWAALDQLHGQINRLFDRELEQETAVNAEWAPAADIEERPERFVLRLDVPGVDFAAVDITLEQGVLSISGTRAKEALGQDAQRRRTERPHGRFRRRFTLPESVDAQNVQASGRNGIIEVTIPKQPKAQPRRIEIASA